jgi:hypothetical protein
MVWERGADILEELIKEHEPTSKELQKLVPWQVKKGILKSGGTVHTHLIYLQHQDRITQGSDGRYRIYTKQEPAGDQEFEYE